MTEFNIEELISMLQDLSIEGLFNPYIDKCTLDMTGAPMIRTNNLKKYLTIFNISKDIFFGESGGYLGLRRSGLPFCDERHMKVVSEVHGLEPLYVATKGGRNKEISALAVWTILQELKSPPCLWNIQPLHPYKISNNTSMQLLNQLTNRAPTKKDYEATKHIAEYIIKNGNFERIFAVGKVAYKYLSAMDESIIGDVEPILLRHPSHGGANIFKEQVASYFELKEPLTKETTIKQYFN